MESVLFTEASPAPPRALYLDTQEQKSFEYRTKMIDQLPVPSAGGYWDQWELHHENIPGQEVRFTLTLFHFPDDVHNQNDLGEEIKTDAGTITYPRGDGWEVFDVKRIDRYTFPGTAYERLNSVGVEVHFRRPRARKQP